MHPRKLTLCMYAPCMPCLPAHAHCMASAVQVFALKEELEDKTLQYPDYYLKAFHAYEEGNLNWLAAFEVESATLSMALRTFPDAGLDAQQAQARLRQGIHGAIQVGHWHTLSLAPCM